MKSIAIIRLPKAASFLPPSKMRFQNYNETGAQVTLVLNTVTIPVFQTAGLFFPVRV